MVFSSETSPTCYANNSALDYCGPDAYTALADRYWRNKGDGTFEDRSNLLRGTEPGAGLGVISADLDDDGRIDFYVANDGDPNHYWRNDGKGGFVEDALMSGIAVNGEGSEEAGMGVTAGDFDRDGDEDIFITHLDGETNTLYVNQGDAFFDDHSNALGLGSPSLPFTGFGTGWIDFDNDGWLDLLILNGAVRSQFEQKDKYPLKQTNQLYHNQKGKTFTNISSKGGPAFTSKEVSRGAAFGDIDNDGDIDVLLSNNFGPARLLRNDAANGANWLGLSLRLSEKGRYAYGAKVTLFAGTQKWMRRVTADGSYLSAQDPRLVFGLGKVAKIDRIEVLWPNGKKQEIKAPKINQYMSIVQGN